MSSNIQNGVMKFAINCFLSGLLKRKFEHISVLIHFCIYRLIKAIENGRRFIWNAVCNRNLKIDVRQENGVLFLKCGKQPGVTNDVMFAYVHTKINILFSV